MKQIFQVENIKCSGCANSVKKNLKDEFGEVKVDLEKNPREIILDIKDEDIAKLKQKMKTMGYPFCSEELNTIETIGTKAKSFVSCAIGKIDK